MAMRVSYGMRQTDLDVPRSVHVARQIARPPCSSLADAIDAIRNDIRAGEESELPECTTSEVTLGPDAVLELHRPNIGPYSEGGEHDLPAAFKTDWTDDDAGDGAPRRRFPFANVDAIIGYGDKAARAVVQRAASRGIVMAIEAADGFKYSMNNAWGNKDADGQRFSYICQDSMQNKDRHANGFTRTLKHLKGEHERGPRKPTYDCKGSISIKCSMVRRTIDIFYRHYAIHSSVAERKAMPRAPRHRASMDAGGSGGKPAEAGGLLGRLQNEETAFATPVIPSAASQGSSNGRSLKRKREYETPSKPGKPLSLVDLLRQSEASAKPAPKPQDVVAAQSSSVRPPPVNYDLPSWQTPPKPPPPPRAQASKPQQRAADTEPYQPPYQPQYSQQPQYQQHPAPQQTPAPRRQSSNAATDHNGYYGLTPASSTNDTTGATPLFTTMKPFRMETPSTVSARARSSCTNCRYSKKRCDETRPVCGACMRSGKYDCAYEGAYGYPASAGQVSGMGGWAAQPASGPPAPNGSASEDADYAGRIYPGFVPQGQQQPPQQGALPQYGVDGGGGGAPDMSQYAQAKSGQQREESPDPWFPKR